VRPEELLAAHYRWRIFAPDDAVEGIGGLPDGWDSPGPLRSELRPSARYGRAQSALGVTGSVRGPSRADNVLINPAHPRFREISENASAVFTWHDVCFTTKLRLARTRISPARRSAGVFPLSSSARRFWQFLTQICQFDEPFTGSRAIRLERVQSVRSTARSDLSPQLIERGNFSAVTSNDPNLDPFSPALR